MEDSQPTARPPDVSTGANSRADTRPQCLQYLDLPFDCTEQDVRDAYKRLAHACHPDQGGDADNFRRLTENYEAALSYVRLRRTKGEYQAVHIDASQYVLPPDNRMRWYLKLIPAAMGGTLFVAWLLGYLLTASILLGSLLLLMVPALTASVKPLYTGAIFVVMLISTFLFLTVGLQSGMFGDQEYGADLLAFALSGITLMSLCSWLISLADKHA